MHLFPCEREEMHDGFTWPLLNLFCDNPQDNHINLFYGSSSLLYYL